jgi:FAD/FMN-containing dehydrogenase
MQITQLKEIVGAANVETRPASLAEFASDMSFFTPMQPRCIVRPGDTTAIQKIVELARETRTPLIPVSSGEPHFRGDTIPGTEGSIIVDMSGMKKVIHIDRKNRVVMFEPGVTFGELIPVLAKEGMRLNMPLLPRRSKSVVGSLLEREPVTMPKYHWDIADPLACLEVVFGTGEIFRTGAAAGSGTLEEQWSAGGAQKEAAGPSSASWYRIIQGSQGTMGIVTWASARCELLPRLEEPFFIGTNDIRKLLETAHWLIRLRLVNECFILNSTNLARIMTENSDEYQRLREGLPHWILFYNIAAYDYFPEERMAGQNKDVRDIAGRIGVEPSASLSGIIAKDLLGLIKQPSSESFWKLRTKGACHDIFCISAYDDLPGLIDTMADTAGTSGFQVHEMGVYLQPIVQGVNWHCEFNLFYDERNNGEISKVKDLSGKATENLMSAGGFFSRPYGPEAGKIINRDAASVKVLKKIKAIVDPDNIMNPGKLCF